MILVIQKLLIKLKEIKVPDTSGEWAYRVMQMYEENLVTITRNISCYSGIRSKIIAQLHSFISNICFVLTIYIIYISF